MAKLVLMDGKLLAEQKRLEEELLDNKSDGSAPGNEEGVRL